VFSGGEALTPELRDRALARLPALLDNQYGPTEISIDTTRWVCAPGQEPDQVPIGRPIANSRLYVVAPELQPMPIDGAGELLVGGAGVTRGYLRRPALTAERFVPDPFAAEPGARLYRTGDLARWTRAGHLEFLGRIDHQVKVRGFRIELGEIEAELTALPGVSQAVVVLREGRSEGDRRLVAYLVGTATAEALRHSLRERLPDYMIPAAFVILAALPLTAHGKVDRKALPAPEQHGGEDGWLAPRTPIEEALAGIWAELLGFSAGERIGANDSFFSLGGHSLLATRVMSRLRSVFGVEMPLRNLFEAPTLAELTARVEVALRTGADRITPPLVPVPREGPLPLSFAQQRLWFIDQLEPGSALYNMPVALRVEGPLDAGVLSFCLGEIVRRHESLRTVFSVSEGGDGAPVQVIHPASPFVLSLVDLAGLPESRREPQALRLAGEEAGRPFDLAHGPLLRGLLLRLAEGDQVVALTMHHIASDGWSMGILVREVAALYTAFATGQPSPLSELPVQYADFAVWQHSWLHGEVLENEIDFWRRQLAGLPPHLALPIDRPRPAAQSYRGASRPVRLPAALAGQATALARREGATLFMVLLAGFQALLARSSGQADLAVGSPVAGRNRMETEGLIGFFVNTLVLRGDLSGDRAGDPTFRELLGRVRETALAAWLHQDVPFEKLVQELAPERSLAYAPLFQVMLALQNAPVESLEIQSLSFRPLTGAGATAKFDLTLSLGETPQGLAGAVEYATDLFDPTTVERLLGCLARLLTGATADPETLLSGLLLLAPSEQHQLLAEWNDTAGDPPQRSIPELFAHHVERTPDAVALIAGDRILTYRQLDREANRLARRLLAAGLEPDAPVGVFLERSPELIVTLLAILKAGGAYLVLDPDNPAERLRVLIQDARLRLVVSDLRSALPDPIDPVNEITVVPFLSCEGTGDGEPIEPRSSPAHLAYISYTSGSTGRPKGVCVEHRAVVRLVLGTNYIDLGPEDVFLQHSPVSFDASTLEIWGPLLNGGRLVVCPPGRLSAGELGTIVERSGVTVLWLTAGLFHAISEDIEHGLQALQGLRYLLAGGDVLSPEHVRTARAALPGTRLINGYGPTENTTFTCFHPVGAELDTTRSLPIGRPIANTRAHVLDVSLHPVPLGVAGELCAGGDGLARGYFRNPALTAERFIPDPFGGIGSRLYHTGDLVRRLADGRIEFLGRLDQQVKIRGFRIEPGEIEAMLTRHPGVGDAVVVAREAAPGDRRLAAYVTPAPTPAPTTAGEGSRATGPTGIELRGYLAELLPEPMVPAWIVVLDRLPLTANGKVDRKALPMPERQTSAEGRLAPRTPVEEVLACIWAEVLGFSAGERVGADDHFFELGGHSLLATRVMSRLRGAFGIEMPLRELFEAPRLSQLAARIEASLQTLRSSTIASPISPIPREGPLPLSFAQQRLWFLDQLESDSPLYNVPVALRVEGPLEGAVLALCLGEIVRRHEALRTVFPVLEGAEGSPVQVIQPAAPLALPVVDLSGLAAAERESQALTLAGEEAVRPFDLARGPLLRGVLLRLAASGEQADHILALTMHHIASDGWSMGILVREVGALYAAFAVGRPSPLPELAVQYADYAVWQRSWLAGEILEGEIAFWRRQLAGLPPLLELPTDRPRPAVQSFRGASCPVRLPAGITRRMETLARREGATLFMVLLAGFQALLARTSGQDDLAVGSPVAGRNREETEGLIGFFVNTLVLRGDLSGRPSFHELLGQVRETALAAYMHQDVPFEKLVEELAPQRSLAHAALFQVMLVLQNAPAESLVIRDLRLRPVGGGGTAAKHDLTLDLGEHDGGLAGTATYATDLFDAATAQRLLTRFERLLAAAVTDPDRPVAELPLLASTELHQLQAEWNPAMPAGGAGLCAHERFAAQVERAPDAVALVCQGRSITARDLNRRANQLARALKQRGIGPEVRVGVFLERTPELVLAILGILKAGGAYVPFDTTYPQDRLAYLLQDSGAHLLLTEEHLKSLLPEQTPPLIFLGADWDEIGRENEADFASGAAPENLAYVLYTSGSTGRPKGVGVSHANLVSYIDAIAAELRVPPHSAYVMISTIAADGGNTALFLSLFTAGRLHVLSRETSLDPRAVAEYFERHPIDFFKIVVSHFAALFKTPFGARLLPRKWLILGGEALGWELVDAIGDLRPTCQVFDHYGPTETTVGVLMNRIDLELSRRLRPPMVPPGRPLANAEMRILDRHQQPVPVGVIGELYAGGACVARGYLNRPDLTAERFVPDPSGAGRLYRTGDLVRYLPDGKIEFLGRADNQVKIRGFRIELGEIEAALVTLAGVHEAVVIAREDGGPGDRRLVAYLAADLGADASGLTAETLRQSLRELLPDYMIPTAFVMLSELPLLSSGKVDRRALPAPERQSTESGSVAPRTPVEEILAGIWTEVLGVDRVGAHDHFFDLGGHSLLATRVTSRLPAAFGVEMPVRDLFEAPVLADLAARVEATRRSGEGRLSPPLVPMASGLREGPLPLSFAQQRLWFIDQLAPGSALYNMPVALHVEGPLRAGVLARCLGEIVRRHEALRTVFAVSEEGEGSPVQVIQPARPFHLPLVDLSGLPASRCEAQALRLAGEEAGRPFDLMRGPLLRGLLLRLAADFGKATAHVVALTMHHIASDGWSMGILVREVTALYAAFAEGRPSPLPELPVQYADFAVWQSSWLRGEILEGEIAYWRRQLAGLPPLLELPTDRPRPAVQSFRGASRPVRLPAGLTRQVEAFARREGATVFMVLLAAFQTLLARISGQDDLAVGSPVAGRNRLETEGLIGFFVNTLVLRGGLAGAPSARELLGRVRETALAAYLHQDVPFEKLVQELTPERSLAHTPLFQAMLVLQNAPAGSPEIESLRLRLMSGAGTTAKLDLTLTLGEIDGELAGAVEHATDLFDAATIDRLIGHYERLLTGMVKMPDHRAGEIGLLSPEEALQLRSWNETAAAYPFDRPLHAWIEEQVDRSPGAVAVVCEGEELSYRELDRRANRLAWRLSALGVGPESRVAVCLERSAELVVALLAVLKAGGGYVPLDPEYPRERLAFMLTDAQPAVLLSSEPLRDRLPPLEVPVLWLDRLAEDIDDAETGDRLPRGCATDLQLAYMIYTSGSTGRPKGVQVPHRALVNFLFSLRDLLRVDPGDRLLAVTSLSFDIAALELYLPLLAGATVEVVGREIATDGERLRERLDASRATFMQATPSTWRLLVRSGWPGSPRLTVLCGGEPLPEDLARDLRARARTVWNLYGPTETTVWSSADRLTGPAPEPPRVTLGRPIANTAIHLLDRHFAPVPLGVPGELYIGGDGVTRGYLRRPDLTAERFLPDPFAADRPGCRLYRTGDLARRLPDGRVEFLGRVDHQVKLRGFRIEPGEIEAALVALAGAREAVVVVREDRSTQGPGDRRLVAYLTGEIGMTTDELRRTLRERLPDYMVPVAFVRLAALPLTPNGKLDRKALPAPEQQSAGERYVAPRTPAEEVLAGIWADLLGREQVGAADNFFDLGGHSLLVVRLMARIEQAFGVRLPIATLFEAPTVERLAEVVQHRSVRTDRSPLVRLHPGGIGRPLFVVHPVGGGVFSYVDLARLLGADRPVYGIQAFIPASENGHQPTLEELAAQYLAAVRQVQAEGPWLLAGWSSGAIMAYEMAQQIERSGGTVSLLALIDPPAPPEGNRQTADTDDISLLAEFAEFGRPSERQRALIREMLEGLDMDTGLDLLIELGQSEGTLPLDMGKRGLREWFSLFRRSVKAVLGYVARPYGGRATLFRASASLAAGAADLTAGWGALADIETYLLNADHQSVVRQPALAGLVEHLQRDLARIES